MYENLGFSKSFPFIKINTALIRFYFSEENF